jgi:hypothetical protein
MQYELKMDAVNVINEQIEFHLVTRSTRIYEFLQGRICQIINLYRHILYIQAASKFIRNVRGLNMQLCIQRTTV